MTRTGWWWCNDDDDDCGIDGLFDGRGVDGFLETVGVLVGEEVGDLVCSEKIY